MIMNLQELNNFIHSLHTKQRLEDEYANILTTLADILDDTDLPWKETYYKSHTGRELYRKLWTYGLKDLMPGDYDGGFRPLSKDDVITAAAAYTDGELLCKYVLCE